MKREIIRKVVNYSKTIKKFFIKRIKKGENSIKAIFGIYNRALDFKPLFGSHFFQKEVI